MDAECSALLPLHEGLIVTTNGEESGVISAEQDTDDVLRVTTVRSWHGLDAWVVEDVDETVVITGGEELLVSRAADGVDVGAIGALGVDTGGLPEELAGDGSPDSVLEVGSAGWVLVARGDLEEEELVSTAVGAEVLGVSAPVESHDVGGVASALALETPVGGSVDVDGVVVGADGQVLVVWGEAHDLDPLGGVLEEVALGVGIGAGSDGDGTIVASNSEPLVVGGDGAGALGVWVLGEGGGAAASGFLSTVGDLDGLDVLAVGGVPEHDLVVVSGGDDGAIGALGKTPDLTFVVRHHDGHLLGGGLDGDGTVTLTDEELVVGAVNSADERWELASLSDLAGVDIDLMDLAVLGAREELALGESESADEALVHVNGLLAAATIIATPDVELTVGATRVTGAVAVPSGASEGGLLVGAEETLLLVAGGIGGIPEVHVLHTSSGESLAAWLGVPADVMDLVGVTLLLDDLVAIVVEDVDLMLVVEIDGADPSIVVDSDGGDATGALGDLYSLLLLASAGVPGEDGGLGADLTGDGGLTLRADADAHNIIGVMVLVIGDVLGSVVDFTATEELLGVRLAVEDNTESSGHVDGLTVGVPVAVLLGVGASVTIDVLELVLSRGLVVVDWVMLIGLDDLTQPWAHGHELLASGLFHFEEVILAAIVVLSTVAIGGFASLLVVLLTATVSSEVGVVGKLAWSRSG